MIRVYLKNKDVLEFSGFVDEYELQTMDEHGQCDGFVYIVNKRTKDCDFIAKSDISRISVRR